MARPKTKGTTIGIHLPLAVDAAVRARAAEQGLSVGLYLAARIARAFPAEAQEANKRSLVVPAAVPVACPHLTFDSIAGGLRKCKTCGGVRGADGVWRSGAA